MSNYCFLNHRQPKLTVCVNGRSARFIHIKRLSVGTPGSDNLQDFVWESTRFLKIYDIAMNDEIELTYLLFSVHVLDLNDDKSLKMAS